MWDTRLVCYSAFDAPPFAHSDPLPSGVVSRIRPSEPATDSHSLGEFMRRRVNRKSWIGCPQRLLQTRSAPTRCSLSLSFIAKVNLFPAVPTSRALFTILVQPRRNRRSADDIAAARSLAVFRKKKRGKRGKKMKRKRGRDAWNDG